MNANKKIKQNVYVIQEREKKDKLKEVMAEINPAGKPETIPKTIIFTGRKSSCEQLANDLWDIGYSVDALHGDRQQFQRTKVMEAFKRGRLQLLVATDVAARGLDVKDIQCVINYDFPNGVNGVEDYVHRIGRTARGGAEGKAYSFFTQESDAKRAGQLIGVLKRAGQEVPEELAKLASFGRGGGGSGWGGRGGGRGFGGRGGRFGGRGGRGSFGGRGGGFGFGGGRGGGRGAGRGSFGGRGGF